MKLTIHRGTHEIGGNCIELKSKNTSILLDFGLPLAYQGKEFNFSKFKGKPVAELKALGILPDIRGIYKGDSEGSSISAIVLSHSHLDHYGLISRHLKPEIPIYLSKGAQKMIECSSIFTTIQVELPNTQTVQATQELAIDDFKITPYSVGHSAFDSLAFYIEAEGIKLFYTGDFRFHGRKKGNIKWFIKNYRNEIDYMIIEGTMLGRNVLHKDEIYVESKALSLMKETEGLVFLMFSPQNIDRLVSLFRATLQADRLFVIDTYTAFLLDSIKDMGRIPNTEWEKIKVFCPDKMYSRLIRIGREDIVEKYRNKQVSLKYLQAYQDRLTVMFRNSMIADFERINKLKKSLLIYSMYEGYLERPNFKELYSFLEKKDIKMEKVHISGHAYIEDLQDFANILAPEHIIPIHTLHPEKYRELFGNKILNIQDKETVDLN